MERMGRAFDTAALARGPSEFGSEGLLDARYRVTKRLGGGGMGEVYEVEHVRLGRHFALKLLRAELSAERELIERFDREARAVASLHSDHVVSIVDSGILSDGRPYFVMERLIGEDLKQVLSATAELPVTRAVNMGIDICLGLHAAHSAGLVHRDLKPENVFVTRGDDARERCKLLDFGVVKLAEQQQTRPGALVGTARYMAPEQVTNGEQITPAADLFAVGVILYRCLSGQHPFAADSLERVLFRIINDRPASLPPHVPSGLAALIEQALSKQPSERPPSALEFARALAHFTHEPRHLERIAGFHVDTALAVDTSDGGVTSADMTPLIETSKAPSLARRVVPLFGAASLLIAATLGVDHLLWNTHAASSAERAREPTRVDVISSPPTRPAPALAPASTVPSPLVAAQPTPVSAVRSARPAQKSASPSAPAKPPAASPSAVKPAPSADAPSLNWFDPRNPYGR